MIIAPCGEITPIFAQNLGYTLALSNLCAKKVIQNNIV